MAILTIQEHIAMVTGEGDPAIIRRAERKLKDYQSTLTSDRHIRKVNSFVDRAEDYAREIAGDDRRTFDLMFHRRMNELTRAAGLRV